MHTGLLIYIAFMLRNNWAKFTDNTKAIISGIWKPITYYVR